MHGFPKLLVSVACVLTLAACGGGGSAKRSSGPATTTTAPGTGASITQAVCSFATRAQVQALLGATESAPGTETALAPGFKTCTWVAPAGSTGFRNTITLNVIRRQGGQLPLTAKPVGYRSTPVSGVGDNAIFSTASSSIGNGLSAVRLSANKGAVSMDIEVKYVGSGPKPASLRSVLVAVARATFTDVGA